MTSLDYCMAQCSNPDSLWNFFGEEGVQDDQQAFPNGKDSVLPIGKPTARGGISPGSGVSGYYPRYGEATKYYGTRYLTRTSVE